MASNSETGHAKNISNFDKAIVICEGLGADYNPSKTALKIPTVKTQFDDALASQTEYGDKITVNDNDKNLRKTDFKPIKKLSTRLLNALKASDASEATIDDAEGFNRKIQGERAINPSTPTNADAPEIDSHSVSQQSYTNIVEHLKGLKNVLASESSYSPNEADLKITSITALINHLSTLNKNETISGTARNNAKIKRDKKLYAPKTGIIDTVEAMKQYVKSVFGISSPQYKQLSKLKFSHPR